MCLNNKDTHIKEIICEAIQDECIGHCNHPYCYKVDNIVDKLKQSKIIISPYSIGDTVYFITGIHNSLVKPAKVSEIYYGGENNFTFNVVTDNYVYFDLPLDEAYPTYEAAEKDLTKRRIR